MAAAVRLVIFLSLVGSGSGTTPLLTAARAAGCSGSDAEKAECILTRLFAPNKEQALADANLSRLSIAPRPPLPGVLEVLLTTGDGMMDVPLSKTDKIAVLGSGDGRLPILAALHGARILAVEKEAVPYARSLLALHRLRDLLNNFGDDLVDRDAKCEDRAAKGDCAKSPDFMLGNCTRSCYNRTQATRLQWQEMEVEFQQAASSVANLSGVTLAILGQDGPKGADGKEVAALTAKMETELPAGAMLWSLDPLPLQGAQVQEISEDGKTSASVPAGGLVFQRRLHLNVSWSRDVPCHVYIRVPKPSSALRPKWPLTVEEAKRLHQAATEELVSLGAMRLSGAVLSEGRFGAAAVAYGAPEAAGRRLARAFGAPAAKLGAQQDFCRCRPRDSSTGYEVSALNLLGMFLLGIHSPQPCLAPPCTAADAVLALSIGELRRQLLDGHEESCDVPPQVLRDLGCLRFSDRRTLLHAALGRKDLQLARAALRSQGAGGLFCRDALGQTVLHHAAQGKPQLGQVNNFTGALQERVNASEAVEWLLKQLRSSAPEVLKLSDNSGRHALFFAEDVATLRTLVGHVGSLSSTDSAGRGILWHAIASNRTDIISELLCDPTGKSDEHRKQLLVPHGEEISSSPLLLAARRVAAPICGAQHAAAAKATLEAMSCTGLRDDFNGSLEDFAHSACKNSTAKATTGAAGA